MPGFTPAIPSDAPLLNRRTWLQVGGVAAVAALGGSVAAAQRRALPGFGKAKSVILIYASGGQSQIDIWDPKPSAPAEVRGEFRPIRSAVPGLLLCEHLPRLTRVADRYTVVRSVCHDDVDHGSASYLALTGFFHQKKSANPLPKPTDLPTYGAILQRLRPSRQVPHSAVHINGPAQVPEIQAPGQFAGLLGRSCEPLLIGDPTHEPLALEGLDPTQDLPAERARGRRALLNRLENASRRLENLGPLLEMNDSYRQAYEVLSARRFREAFDLSREPASVRERYGRNRSGQACLLARRLVEVGVPWITVIWNHNNRGQDTKPDDTDAYGWDTHNDIFVSLRERLLPRFDQGFSALLLDLEQRGLLETTLVVCQGEFGRAPLVALEPRFAGSSPGRKHWAGAYSVVLAGAGISRGRVYGASDRSGAYVQSNPVGPWDLAATMFHALGIDPAGQYRDATNRPHAISSGKPILDLYS